MSPGPDYFPLSAQARSSNARTQEAEQPVRLLGHVTPGSGEIRWGEHPACRSHIDALLAIPVFTVLFELVKDRTRHIAGRLMGTDSARYFADCDRGRAKPLQTPIR